MYLMHYILKHLFLVLEKKSSRFSGIIMPIGKKDKLVLWHHTEINTMIIFEYVWFFYSPCMYWCGVGINSDDMTGRLSPPWYRVGDKRWGGKLGIRLLLMLMEVVESTRSSASSLRRWPDWFLIRSPENREKKKGGRG